MPVPTTDWVTPGSDSEALAHDRLGDDAGLNLNVAGPSLAHQAQPVGAAAHARATSGDRPGT